MNSGGVISWRSSHSTVRPIRKSGGAPWPALPGKTTIVDRVIMDRRFRGQGLGIYLTGLALDYLSHGAWVIALFPGSLEDDDTPGDVARARLGRAWSRLGFQHYRNGTWILDPGMRTLRWRAADRSCRRGSAASPWRNQHRTPCRLVRAPTAP